MKLSICWFRRDLRLEDNTALHHACRLGSPVLCVFIFDDYILQGLPEDDARVNFIYKTLSSINFKLNSKGSSLKIYKGKPEEIWQEILLSFDIAEVFINKDYEPYAIERDKKIKSLLEHHGKGLNVFKDHVIFEEEEVLKSDGRPYTVFTPYKNKWMEEFNKQEIVVAKKNLDSCFYPSIFPFPALSKLGFQHSSIKVREFDLSRVEDYASLRNIPGDDATSYLGPHLRFGTVSIREIVSKLTLGNLAFLNELIWREFFIQILFHFPKVVERNFQSKYNEIVWRNNNHEFDRWCTGETGYPLVDAGMRQLNKTGFMHNRVRMVVASFLCKHLLIAWQWGEAYFAGRLLDYELASNNGNWQWAAGTGCDAAPYFRIFNPLEQMKKFDKDLNYVKQWVPEYGTPDYPSPIVDHQFARHRALEAYKKGLGNR